MTEPECVRQDSISAEFRNGGQYWLLGNYLTSMTDFLDGVDYTVGKCGGNMDWTICQPLDLSAKCEVLGSSVWTIRFPLDQGPEHGTLLRVDFCGSREGSGLALSLNGNEIGGTGPLPEDGAMHRDSHHGFWFERTFKIFFERLLAGGDVLQFRLHRIVRHQGILYDFIRMKAVSPAVPAL